MGPFCFYLQGVVGVSQSKTRQITSLLLAVPLIMMHVLLREWNRQPYDNFRKQVS